MGICPLDGLGNIPYPSSMWWNLGLEAFTVFLGITAGFLVERWKQRREEQKEATFYLESFHRDLTRIREELERSLQEYEAWIRAMDRALKEKKKEEISRYLGTLKLTDVSFPSYVHAMNSGGFRVLHAYVLRDKLTESALQLERIQRMDHILESFYLSQVLPALFRAVTREIKTEDLWVVAQSYRSILVQKRALLRKAHAMLPPLLSLLKQPPA